MLHDCNSCVQATPPALWCQQTKDDLIQLPQVPVADRICAQCNVHYVSFTRPGVPRHTGGHRRHCFQSPIIQVSRTLPCEHRPTAKQRTGSAIPHQKFRFTAAVFVFNCTRIGSDLGNPQSTFIAAVVLFAHSLLLSLLMCSSLLDDALFLQYG